MQTLLLIALSLCFALNIAFARLGETEEQIEARYGKPQKSVISYGHMVETYEVNGFSIMVSFMDGKSASEMYSKSDKTKLSDAELQKLLEVNALGSRWILDPTSRFEAEWKLENGAATALSLGICLTISSKEYHKFFSDVKKKQMETEANALNPF